jgi:single stranded DNA-binding protein
MYQQTLLIGRVGQITPAATNGGTSVCNFSLVTTKSVKQDDGSFKEFEEWHRLTAFGPIADHFNDKVEVGQLLFLDQLELRTRKYKKNNEAEDRYITELVVTTFPKKLPRYFTKDSVEGTSASTSRQPARSQPPRRQQRQAAPAQNYSDDVPV